MTVEKNRKKRIVLVILAIVMVCCLIIAGTLAWLQYRTDEAINTFTLGEGVKVELKEEKYNKEENQERLGEFTPGMLLDKDPTVYIPEVDMDEYIAVTVRYYIEEVVDGNKITLKEVDYNTFKNDYAAIYSFFKETNSGEFVKGNVISADDEKNYTLGKGFRNGWVHDEDYHIFYYGSVKDPDTQVVTSNSAIVTTNSAIDDIAFECVTSGAAITLFDKVKISKAYDRYSEGFVEEKYRYAEGDYVDARYNPSIVHKTKGQLKGFQIDVCAYAVQGNISTAEGKSALMGLIEEHEQGISSQE